MRKSVFVNDIVAFNSAISKMLDEKILCLDTETSGLDPYTCKLLLLQLTGVRSDTVYIIPGYLIGTNEKAVLRALLTGKELVIHNAGFDLKFLQIHLGFDITSPDYTVFDTFLAEEILGAGTPMNLRAYASLKNTVYRRLGIVLEKNIREQFIGHSGEIFSESQIKYAGDDLEHLADIRKQQVEEAKKYELVPTFKLEFELIKFVTKMSLDGIQINTTLWREIISNQENLRKVSYTNLIEVMSPFMKQDSLFSELSFNINSTTQTLKFLKNDLGLYLEDTSEQSLRSQNNPVCDAILEYREHEKMLSAFGEKALGKVNSVTGRLHPEFNQCATATGRFSSDNPNVQQIPGRGEGAKLRQCFEASQGFKMVCADYSQIELRILAEFSQEPKLIEAYTSGIDVHTQTASIAFGIPHEQVRPDQRKIAKIINFATVYGGGPAAISRGLIQVISEDEAHEILNATFGYVEGEDIQEPYLTLGKEFVEAFFRGMPKAKEYLDRSGQEAIWNRWSQTPLGRKRFYWELDSLEKPKSKYDKDYQSVVSSVRRRAMNHPIQGCSADITKKAIINIGKAMRERYGPGIGKILLQVHDEIVVEVPEEDADNFKEIQRECMVSAGQEFLKSVPVELDINVTDYWDK